MPDDAGIARTALGAVAAWEGRSLSPDRPRRTQLPCWIAAVALHGVAAALAMLYTAVPAPLVQAPIPAEFVTIEVAGSDAAPLPAEPAVEAAPSQSDLPPPAPVAAEPIEPPPAPVAAEPIESAPAEPTAAPPPAPLLPARIVDPPRPKPREVARRSSPPAPQPPVSAPAVAAGSADVPTFVVQAPAPATTPPPVASAAPAGESDYIGKLLGWLERFKDYPRGARLRRIEGQVVLELSIMADGQIASARVVAGSGHAALDDAALDMVRRAAPVPVPRDGPLALRVPVMFALGAR